MKIMNLLATKAPAVFSVHPHQTLKEVVALLVAHRIGALPVLDAHGVLVGIVSERDIIHSLAKNDQALTLPVADVMTPQVICGAPQDDVPSVMQAMTQGRFRHLPIIENEQLIGIISIGDIVKAQLAEYQGEIHNLLNQLDAS